MSSQINLSAMIAKVIEEANEKVIAMQRRAAFLSELEAVGITFDYPQGVVKYGFNCDVKKSDLTKIRKVVGRLTMVGKDTAWDFKDTNELEVSLAPVDKEIPLVFKYRTKYRKGGKCKVIENVSPASVSVTLVCEK